MTVTMFELSNTFANAVEKAGKSTVLVDARQRFPASGIVFSSEIILTANHVIEREEDVSVVLSDNTRLKATIAGRDPGSDLAVLKLEKAMATLSSKADMPRVGQIIMAIARPSMGGIEASLGIISAISGPVRTQSGTIERYYRTDTTPFPGFSGGPLIDSEGNFLGINTSGFGRGSFITLPVTFAWRIADELARNGSLKRGYIGIRSQPVELTSAAQTALKRTQSTGLLLVGIETPSPAESGGLLVGDTVVGINENSVTDHDELFSILSGDLIGKNVTIEILRGGLPQKLNVIVGEYKTETKNNHHQSHGHHHR